LNLQAVILVPAKETARWAKQCLDYCAAAGYHVAGVVLDNQGGWTAVTDMVQHGLAQVIVVARSEHLPRYRVPRIEVVASQIEVEQGEQMPVSRRRPRLRDGGAR
jgi:hypothetical protein